MAFSRNNIRPDLRLNAPDFPLFLLTVVLASVGLIMVYSASAVVADAKFGNSWHFLGRQTLWLALGSLALAGVSRVNLARWRPLAVPALFVGLLLMALVCVPGVGSMLNGARRWFRLGPLSFQPSEVMKIIWVFFLAESLSRRRLLLEDWRSLKPYAIFFGLIGVFLYFQHDFGSLVVLSALTFMMLFLAGVRLSVFMVPAAALLSFMAVMVVTSPYRLKRITAFLDPWKDPFNSGYQLIQSLIAVGSGGPLGVGLSNSMQKLNYIPSPHNDFIFAIIGEELGLWGACGIVLLFTLFAMRGFKVAAAAAQKSDDGFEGLLAAGMTGLIVFQAFMNLGVVTGLLPTKGLPLPLVSYGGTSLVFTMVAVGLLLNVSRRSKLHGEKMAV